MQDMHPYPSGSRMKEMSDDMEEMRNAENFNSTELTETLGKLRMVTKPK